jgi:hypothetical protein
LIAEFVDLRNVANLDYGVHYATLRQKREEVMRLFIAITLVVVVNADAAADEVYPCDIVGEVAERIMLRRQEGVPLQEELGIANKVPRPSTHDVFETMVLDAYSKPLVQSRDVEQRVIEDFGEEQRLACMDMIKRRKRE